MGQTALCAYRARPGRTFSVIPSLFSVETWYGICADGTLWFYLLVVVWAAQTIHRLWAGVPVLIMYAFLFLLCSRTGHLISLFTPFIRTFSPRTIHTLRVPRTAPTGARHHSPPPPARCTLAALRRRLRAALARRLAFVRAPRADGGTVGQHGMAAGRGGFDDRDSVCALWRIARSPRRATKLFVKG